MLQPAAWGAVAIVILCLHPQQGRGTARRRRLSFKLALGAAVFQICLTFSAGLAAGFGRNPGSFTPVVMLVNLVLLAANLLGMELSRNWLVNRAGRRSGTWWLAGVALLYTFLPLPLNQLPGPHDGFGVLAKFCAASFLPAFTESLTASFLAAWGGAPATLAYRSLPAFVDWFCPVLPDTDWTFKALTGTLAPALGLAVATDFLAAKRQPARRRRRGGTVGWVILSAGLLVTVWFTLGLFPVRPIVIRGGSMRPVFAEGDVVVVTGIDPRHLKAGQIIAYRNRGGPETVVHRVCAVRREGEEILFTTKGDAAGRSDPAPVHPEQVVGKVVLVIPKAGWVALLAKRLSGW